MVSMLGLNCKACSCLQDQIKHLRAMNEKLTSQIIALSNANVYHALESNVHEVDESMYYGGKSDTFIERDEIGQKIIVKKPFSVETQ